MAPNNRPLQPKVAHSSWKVAQNDWPPSSTAYLWHSTLKHCLFRPGKDEATRLRLLQSATGRQLGAPCCPKILILHIQFSEKGGKRTQSGKRIRFAYIQSGCTGPSTQRPADIVSITLLHDCLQFGVQDGALDGSEGRLHVVGLNDLIRARTLWARLP